MGLGLGLVTTQTRADALDESSSAYALQKTSFFALECSISVIFFVTYGRTYIHTDALMACGLVLPRG